MNNEPIKVLLVDDSPVILLMLTRILSAPETGIKVVGAAKNGADALQKIPEVNPQVVCTDLQMPIMDGLELTRNIMARCPLPILVLSALVERGVNDDNIFKLLEAGAVEIIPKPRGILDGDLSKTGKDLIAKIKILAGIKTFTRHQPPIQPRVSNQPNISPSPARRIESLLASRLSSSPLPVVSTHKESGSIIPKSAKIITIGASTGGPQALQKILTGLPPKLSIPIVCIQHVSEGFSEFLIEWLGVNCPLPVRAAQIGKPVLPGTVYFPPDTKHLIIDEDGHFSTTTMGSGALNQRPSITFAFNSIAQYYGSSAVGILLTGMGSDGTDGLLNIRKAGGTTIAQDESSSVVFGMPKVAKEIGAVQHVLSLFQIVENLGKL